MTWEVWGGPVAAALALLAVYYGVRALLVRSGPDEWLLQIRDGVLVRAGVGISVLRWPQDRVVRFPAATQRVRFEAEVLTRELLPVKVEAFALWSVLPEDPLLACRRLGLAAQPHGPHGHLLSRPQYHAFQQAFTALVRRHAGDFPLAELCRNPAPLVDAVLAEAIVEMAPLGARVESVQAIEVRPSDPALLARLSAEVDEEIARTAARAKDETTREKDRLGVATEQARALAQLESERSVGLERERLAQQVRAQQAAALEAELALSRRRAEAEAEALRIATAAEVERPDTHRAHELEHHKVSVLGEALKSWPIREARWVGLEGPVQAAERILGLVQ
jgi:hypothetical protein